jgi:hypothetical protein
MAKGTRTSVKQKAQYDSAWGGGSEERQRMIQEAAYYRFIRRGFSHGHALDDWLAAEAELLRGNREQQAAEAVEPVEFEVQQSSTHGAMADDALKRIIRKHPQRDIPQIEGIEPQDAPLKE